MWLTAPKLICSQRHTKNLEKRRMSLELQRNSKKKPTFFPSVDSVLTRVGRVRFDGYSAGQKFRFHVKSKVTKTVFDFKRTCFKIKWQSEILILPKPSSKSTVFKRTFQTFDKIFKHIEWRWNLFIISCYYPITIRTDKNFWEKQDIETEY